MHHQVERGLNGVQLVISDACRPLTGFSAAGATSVL
jgi:hypothetical protein